MFSFLNNKILRLSPGKHQSSLTRLSLKYTEQSTLLEELKNVNEELRQARRAALNIMEDAILSKEALQVSEQRYRHQLEKEVEFRTSEANASKEALRAILDSSFYSIQAFEAVRDGNGKIIDFICTMNNKKAVEQNGDAIGKSFLRQNRGKVHNGLFEKFVLVTETGIPVEQQQVYQNERCERWFHHTLVKMGDGVVMNAIDITERVEADQEINRLRDEIVKRATDKYKTLFETIEEGFCVIEMIYDDRGSAVDLLFHEANPAYERLTGLQNPVGKRMSEVLNNPELQRLNGYDHVVRTGESLRTEQYNAESGKWFRVYASKIGGDNSRQVAIIFDDITESKRADARSLFLSEFTKDLVTIDTITATFAPLGEKIGRHFNVGWCVFGKITEDLEPSIATNGWSAEGLPALKGTYKMRDFLTDDQLAKNNAGELCIVENTQTDPRVNAETCKTLGVMSFITVPLSRNGRFLFQLNIIDTKPRAWRDDEIDLLKEVTARMWTRFERALAEEALRESELKYRSTLEKEVRERTEKFISQQTLLREAEKIGRMGSWEKNLENGELFWSDELFRIYGIEPQSVKMTTNLYVNNFVHPSDRKKVSAHVKRIYDELVEDPLEYRIITPDGEKVVLSQPQIKKNTDRKMIRGIVRDITKEKKASQQVVKLRLEQQRAILNTILITQEAERERIGEGLHNGIGQILYAAKMKQEMIHVTGEKNQSVLKEANKILEEAISETRNLSFQLVPTVLKDYGLEVAITSMIRRFQTKDLEIQVEITGLHERLAQELEFGLYRVSQELLNNVVRHAEASRALIHINVNQKEIFFEVTDNGIGFDPAEIGDLHKGIGLQSIYNRAKLLGAKVSVSSSPGKGTSVSLKIRRSRKKD
jgi:PAS domain S-box-containing protein